MHAISIPRYIGVALVLCAVWCPAGEQLDIPLERNKWEVLKYRKIPANQVDFRDGVLQLTVKNSAGPLVYALPKPTLVKGVLAKGTLSGLPKIPADKTQGAEGADDFAFRVGLVIRGNQTLGWAQRLLAPDWVERLHDIAPDGAGIDRVLFLNLANQPGPDWKRRRHPGGRELIDEEVVGKLQKAGPFQVDVKLKKALPVLGVWISCDGDDTNSEFQVKIETLTLIKE